MYDQITDVSINILTHIEWRKASQQRRQSIRTECPGAQLCHAFITLREFVSAGCENTLQKSVWNVLPFRRSHRVATQNGLSLLTRGLARYRGARWHKFITSLGHAFQSRTNQPPPTEVGSLLSRLSSRGACFTPSIGAVSRRSRVARTEARSLWCIFAPPSLEMGHEIGVVVC